MKHLLASSVISFLVAACCLLAYDRFVFRPSQVVGVVDLAEVYRTKETEFASLITASRTDDDRKRAMELATEFSKRLPIALDSLPAACRCLVVLKSAVAGSAHNVVDLTPLLRARLGEKS